MFKLGKKGFTLVELMSVIVVLTIIIAIAMPVYSKIKMSIEKRNYENKVELIQIAAAKYAEDTNITTIYVDELVKQGYIDADDEKGNVYNDLTKERINCYIVQTEEKSGIYYSELLDQNYEESGICPANIPNDLTIGFKIIMYDGSLETKLEYNEDSKWWTKNDVILKADFGENQPTDVEWYEGYSNTALTENFSGVNNQYLTISINDGSVLQQNYTAKTRTKDGKLLTATVRVYIDKIKPQFYSKDAEGINDKWTTSKEYNIKAYDNESGLYKYLLKNTGEDCPTTKKEFSIGKKKNEITENGTYKACIIDQVGNTSEKEVAITKIDKNPPKCIWTGESKVWTNQNRTIKLEITDEESGFSSTTSTITKNWDYTSGVTKTANLAYPEVSDLAGNTVTCTKTADVYVDKVAPQCTWTGESKVWTNQNRTIELKITDEGSGLNFTAPTITKSWNYTSGEISTVNLSYDEVSDLAGNTVTCTKTANVYVDKVAPSLPTSGSIGAVSDNSQKGSIKTLASGSTDGGSGVKEYRYLITNNATIPTDKSSFKTTNTTFNRSCGRSYYAWVVTVDNVGNISAIKSLGNTSDGQNKYSDTWIKARKNEGDKKYCAQKTNSCLLKPIKRLECCKEKDTKTKTTSNGDFRCDITIGHRIKTKTTTTTVVDKYVDTYVCSKSTSTTTEYSPGGFGDDGCYKAGGNARGTTPRAITGKGMTCQYGHNTTTGHVYNIYNVDNNGNVIPTSRYLMNISPSFACPHPDCVHQGYCSSTGCSDPNTYWWVVNDTNFAK